MSPLFCREAGIDDPSVKEGGKPSRTSDYISQNTRTSSTTTASSESNSNTEFLTSRDDETLTETILPD